MHTVFYTYVCAYIFTHLYGSDIYNDLNALEIEQKQMKFGEAPVFERREPQHVRSTFIWGHSAFYEWQGG